MKSEELALKIRKDVLIMAHLSKGSHIACALSIADVVAVLYNDILNVFPDDPRNPSRDRFILSKGHAGSAVYAVLAEKGFFPVDKLKEHYANGSFLSGHVSHKGVLGVELSTGSLGHGACVAAGMAFAAQYDKKSHKIIVVVGDGECEEGCIWEMALFANHFKLSNLVVIVDCNKFQALGRCEEVLGPNDLAQKWLAFGFNTIEINGHDHCEIKNAFNNLNNERPNCIIAHTIKGKGISFMENNILWHYRDPQGDYFDKALKELEGPIL